MTPMQTLLQLYTGLCCHFATVFSAGPVELGPQYHVSGDDSMRQQHREGGWSGAVLRWAGAGMGLGYASLGGL